MAKTTTSEISHAVNNYYDRKLLMKAKPLLVHLNWGQVRNIPKGNTETIKFRRYSLLTSATTALTEGVSPEGSQLSKTDLTATISQYGDYVKLTDKLKLTTPDPILSETADVLGQQTGNTLDQLMRTVLAAATTIQYAGSATSNATITSAMMMDKAEVQEAVLTLKDANAQKITSMVNASNGFNTSPLPACFVGVCSPSTGRDLKNEPGWIPVEEYGSNKKVMPGEIGTLDEVRFVETTNAKVASGAGSGSIDVHYTIILASNAYGITRISGAAIKNIIKPLGSAGTADPLDQRSTSGWKATFVGKILNQNFMVVLRHAVTS